MIPTLHRVPDCLTVHHQLTLTEFLSLSVIAISTPGYVPNNKWLVVNTGFDGGKMFFKHS